ncbi:MAG: aminotransferase class V-fold PLP-dependent enzyme [Planctomycetota bacterium]
MSDSQTTPASDSGVAAIIGENVQNSAESMALLRDAPWQWWRNQMPVTEKWVYLDHAAVGPLTQPAATAIARYADEACREGDTVWPDWNRRLESLRDSAASLVGAERDEVFLIPNTSTGINVVAEGFPWKPGDNVVVPEGEFPSNLFPWQNQGSKGVEIRQVSRRGHAISVEDLIENTDENTRVIAVSWVGYASGFRVDLESLIERAHDRGILVFVDAIQGMGVFDLNVADLDVDFLAADGHKWMLGPEGMGFGVIRSRHLDSLRCTNVGWMSVRDTFNYSQPELQLRPSAARFEPGSPNMVSSAALAASLSLFLSVREHHGPTAIENRILDLVESLRERLEANSLPSEIPADRSNRSGIVTLQVPGQDPAQVRSHLLDRQIVTSCRGGGIRVALHAYNNEKDLDRLIEALRELR